MYKFTIFSCTNTNNGIISLAVITCCWCCCCWFLFYSRTWKHFFLVIFLFFILYKLCTTLTEKINKLEWTHNKQYVSKMHFHNFLKIFCCFFPSMKKRTQQCRQQQQQHIIQSLFKEVTLHTLCIIYSMRIIQ